MIRTTLIAALITTSFTQASTAQSPEQLYQSFYQGIALDNRCSFLKFAERAGFSGMIQNFENALPETISFETGEMSFEAYQTYLEKLRDLARGAVQSIGCTELHRVGQYLLPTREWLALENYSNIMLAFQSPDLSDEYKQAGVIFESFLKQLYGDNFETFGARAQQMANEKFQIAFQKDATPLTNTKIGDEDWDILLEIMGEDPQADTSEQPIPTFYRERLIKESAEILRAILFELKFDQAGLVHSLHTHNGYILSVLRDKEITEGKANYNIIGTVSQVTTADSEPANIATLVSNSGDVIFTSWSADDAFLSERSITVYAAPLDLTEQERGDVMFSYTREWRERARPIHILPAESGCIAGPCFVLTRAQIEATRQGDASPELRFAINKTAAQAHPADDIAASYSISGSSIEIWYDYLSAP